MHQWHQRPTKTFSQCIAVMTSWSGTFAVWSTQLSSAHPNFSLFAKIALSVQPFSTNFDAEAQTATTRTIPFTGLKNPRVWCKGLPYRPPFQQWERSWLRQRHLRRRSCCRGPGFWRRRGRRACCAWPPPRSGKLFECSSMIKYEQKLIKIAPKDML